MGRSFHLGDTAPEAQRVVGAEGGGGRFAVERDQCQRADGGVGESAAEVSF